MGFTHVDMAAELARKFNGRRYTAVDRYLWWRDDVLSRAKSGQFRVCVVDPASEIEDGIADYIKTHVGEFDLTLAQIQKSAGLFWGAMKKEWKLTLEQFRPLFETLYLTVHLRDQFVGNAPSGKREPKGKDTLMELASLSLWFDRTADKDGSVSAAPAANVLKSRLARPTIDPETGEIEIVPILPPRLPKATPAAIRGYIAKPPNYKKLKEDERVHEKQMTDEEKIRLQAQIANDQRATAEAEVTRIERMSQAAAAQQSQAAQAAAMPAADQSAAAAASQQAKTAARGQAANAPVAAAKAEKIIKLAIEVFGDSIDDHFPAMLASYGAEKVSGLHSGQADNLELELLEINATRKTEAAAARGAELSEGLPDAAIAREKSAAADSNDVPFDADFQGNTEPMSDEQKSLLGPAIDLAFPTEAAADAGMPGLLQFFKVERVRDLTRQQADAFLSKLREIATELGSKAGDKPGTITPEQFKRLQRYAETTGWTPDEQQAWLKARKYSTFRQLSESEADARIEELMSIELGFSKGTPGN
jgi:hypothetical protein